VALVSAYVGPYVDAGDPRLLLRPWRFVPSVIGQISDDPHVDVNIALRSATTHVVIVRAAQASTVC
jgi:hypothetical protein